MHRGRVPILGTAVALITSLLLPGAAGAAAGPGRRDGTDLTIVSSARTLSAAEVRSFDVTDSRAGTALLEAAAADGIDVNRRPFRAFDFHGQKVVVDAKTPLTVHEGRNRAGERVHDVVPFARPVAALGTAGYAVPPEDRWTYNTDGVFQTYLGTWKQSVWWTITAAWNYKPCGACTAHQYFRMYGKLQAATLTGAKWDEGFKRAWIEFDKDGAWGGSPMEFEPPTPEESYHGSDAVTLTVGYGSNADIKLNVPPLTVGGGASSSYTGSMSRSIENWHPVVRAEISSGGVQWCRYDFWEYTGTKAIAAQVGIRQAVNGQLGGWYILKGMQDVTDRCPNPL